MSLLPQPATRFFGREDDVARLARLCDRGASIVTVWGPPGVGKTRLAIELCRRGALARAWFCDLASARDLADVCAAVVGALDPGSAARSASPRDAAAALAAAPQGLLVLDGFEAIASHAASALAAWAEAASQVALLVTSRERLRLGAEITHEVLPLAHGDARDLFVDRVGACAPAAALDASCPEELDALVARLEGIPLAIELAAARMDVLGARELAARLSRPLELLGRGVRDGHADHTSLERAIDASVRLLDDAERDAFAQCAVFRGSFTLEAAEAVVGLERGAIVLDALQSLRDRSLLRCVADGGAVRFAFFAAIRARALEELRARPDLALVRTRHADFHLRRPDDAVNLVDAIDFALDDPRPERLAQVFDALARTDAGAAPDAMVELFERALARADAAAVAPLARARVELGYGRALHLRGRPRDARAALERARDLAGDDPISTRDAWIELGLVHHQARDIARARECYESALDLGEEDDVARARCVGNIGALEHDRRCYDAALEHYERALAVFRARAEHRLEGIFLTNVAVLRQERGAAAHARATYELALDRLALAGDRRLCAITRTNLGFFLHEVGELEAARDAHERALAELADLVDPRSVALCLGRLAMCLAALGRDDEAAVACARADRILAPVDDRVATATLRLFHAFVDLRRGKSAAIGRDELAFARAPSFDGEASLVDVCDDARTAARLLERALAERALASSAPSGDPTAAAAGAAAAAAAGALVVGPDGAWFRTPDGVTCDLGQRRVLRRLLWSLAERHRDATGEGLGIEDLREAGWPGERALPASALNRVHVALTELRRRGLRRCLVRRGARYLIDPMVRVELAPAELDRAV